MLLFLQHPFLQIMFNGLRIIYENDVNSDQSEVPYNMKKAISKSFSEHKTAKILLIVSALTIIMMWKTSLYLYLKTMILSW